LLSFSFTYISVELGDEENSEMGISDDILVLLLGHEVSVRHESGGSLVELNAERVQADSLSVHFREGCLRVGLVGEVDERDGVEG